MVVVSWIQQTRKKRDTAKQKNYDRHSDSVNTAKDSKSLCHTEAQARKKNQNIMIIRNDTQYDVV
jgi:hypothetical protein